MKKEQLRKRLEKISLSTLPKPRFYFADLLDNGDYLVTSANSKRTMTKVEFEKFCNEMASNEYVATMDYGDVIFMNENAIED